MSAIPYTHWAYFADQAAADRCAVELNELGCLVRVDAPGTHSYPGWLLRASRDILLDELVARHEEAETFVARHDGIYDGGEATYLPTGGPAFGSAADEFFSDVP